jgi:hypothetical protein
VIDNEASLVLILLLVIVCPPPSKLNALKSNVPILFETAKISEVKGEVDVAKVTADSPHSATIESAGGGAAISVRSKADD